MTSSTLSEAEGGFASSWMFVLKSSAESLSEAFAPVRALLPPNEVLSNGFAGDLEPMSGEAVADDDAKEAVAAVVVALGRKGLMSCCDSDGLDMVAADEDEDDEGGGGDEAVADNGGLSMIASGLQRTFVSLSSPTSSLTQSLTRAFRDSGGAFPLFILFFILPFIHDDGRPDRPSTMAPLPPRNLPINTSGSGPVAPPATPRKPSTPSASSKAHGRASRQSTPSSSSGLAAAAPSTPTQVAPSTDGLVSRADETTFHRRLRQILWDHRAARSVWEDIADEDFARTVSSLASNASAIDEALARLEAATSGSRESLRVSDELGALLRTHARLKAQVVHDLEAEHGQPQQQQQQTVLARLMKQASKMDALSHAAEKLLLEAIKARGDKFAVVDPLWSTWQMVSFGKFPFLSFCQFM